MTDTRCPYCHHEMEHHQAVPGDLYEPPSPAGFDCDRCGYWRDDDGPNPDDELLHKQESE